MPPAARRDLQLRQLQRAASKPRLLKPKPKPVVKPSKPTKMLADLPFDCLSRVVAMLPTAEDIAHIDCVSKQFHDPCDPATPSVVEQGLRLRADHHLDTNLPDGERSWTQKLLWDERRRRAAERQPLPVVACGAMHTAFVDAAGCVLTCGVYHASVGFLGHGPDVFVVSSPRVVPALAGVAARGVAASSHHTLVLGVDGLVYACGRGDSGRLGNGSETEHEYVPMTLDATRHVRVCAIAAGRDHSLMCDEHGVAWSCGAGKDGRLGHGGGSSDALACGSVCTPQPIEALRGTRVCAVAAGADASYFLSDSGSVLSCGRGDGGALGHGGTYSRSLPALVKFPCQNVCIRAIAAGGAHCLFVDLHGSVHSCGQGTRGQLGHGDDAKQLAPRRVAALSAVTVSSAAAGEAHSLFVTAGGELFSCGWNINAQLGHGDKTLERLTPQAVTSLAGVSVRGAAAGYSHSLAFDESGRVYGFGNGTDECLGLQLRGDAPFPIEYTEVRVAVGNLGSERVRGDRREGGS